VLKGSFDAFNDVKARQMLCAFAADTALVLAHIEIEEKSNEIPAVRSREQFARVLEVLVSDSGTAIAKRVGAAI
jgi:hypothetical protein